MYEICRAFEGIARNAIEKAEREMNTRQKRKHERDQRKFGSVDLSAKSSGTTSTPTMQSKPTSRSSQTQSTTSQTASPITKETFDHPPGNAYTGPIPSQVFQQPNPFLPPQQYQAQQAARQQQQQQVQLQQILQQQQQQQPLFPPSLGVNNPAFPGPMHPHTLLPHGGNNFAGLQNAWPSSNYDFLSGLDHMGGGGDGMGATNDLLGGQFGFTGTTGGSGGGDGSGITGTVGSSGAGGDARFDDANSFVPQDLWSMPMTFEWDWGDVNVGGM